MPSNKVAQEFEERALAVSSALGNEQQRLVERVIWAKNRRDRLPKKALDLFVLVGDVLDPRVHVPAVNDRRDCGVLFPPRLALRGEHDLGVKK